MSTCLKTVGMSLTFIPLIFDRPEELKVVKIASDVINELENQPQIVPAIDYLNRPQIVAATIKKVEEQYCLTQLELDGIAEKPKCYCFKRL
jgi:hypothetical protein